MKRSPRAELVVLTALLLAAGCSSPQPRYFTLVPPNAPAKPSSADYAFEVLPVQVPAQVDQSEFVVRLSHNELVPLEFTRWAAPLGDEVRDTLAQDLMQILGVADMHGVPQPSLPVYRVQLALRRFDSTPGGSVAEEAVWSVHPPDQDTPPLTCRDVLTAPAGGNAASIVAAHQQLLQMIAVHIAENLRALSAQRPPRCDGSP